MHLWDPRGGTVARLVAAEQPAPVALLAISPDASRVAAVDSQHRIHGWDPATGRHLGTLTGHTAGITACAPSPDSQWLATTSADHTVRIWDMRRHWPATVVRVDGQPDDIAWLPSARQLCVVGRHGTYLFRWFPQPT